MLGAVEDEMEIAAVLVVSRTEERGPKLSIHERPFCDRLRDGSGKPVQPVYRGSDGVSNPVFDLVQNGFTGEMVTC